MNVRAKEEEMAAMRVLDHFTIKGRGEVYVIDVLPAELECGMQVEAFDGSRWRVFGVETHAMPRSHTNGKLAGLLLRADVGPNVGDELHVVIERCVPTARTREEGMAMGTSNAEHPMQPLVMDGNVVRFKRNAIINRLVKEGVINLNRIAMWLDSVPIEDAEQFWQLLGYSVSGYGELSFIRPETLAKVDGLAAEMVGANRRTRKETKAMNASEAFQTIRTYFDTQRGDVLGAMNALEKFIEKNNDYERGWKAGLEDATKELWRVANLTMDPPAAFEWHRGFHAAIVGLETFASKDAVIRPCRHCGRPCHAHDNSTRRCAGADTTYWPASEPGGG